MANMIPLNSEANKITKTVGRLWCQLVHNAATWPIHGHYRCRTCRRQYPVPWAQASPSETVLSHRAPTVSLNSLRRAA